MTQSYQPRWYDWWRPLGVGHTESEAAYLNLLLPFMNPFEQAGAARRIAGIDSPDIRGRIKENYALPSGGPASEQSWFGRLAGLENALANPRGWIRREPGMAPGFEGQWAEELASLEGDPNLSWLHSLGQVAAQVGTARTRQQQRDARAAIEQWLTSAPETMSGIGESLLNPYLNAPRYGAAATFGTYANPYRIRGGLVANPWYV